MHVQCGSLNLPSSHLVTRWEQCKKLRRKFTSLQIISLHDPRFSKMFKSGVSLKCAKLGNQLITSELTFAVRVNKSIGNLHKA